MITRFELCDLLVSNFAEMQVVVDKRKAEGYFPYDTEIVHGFYSCKFAPFAVKQLEAGNIPMLKKIFDFIEYLHVNGDEDVENVVWVSVCEPIYNKPLYDEKRDLIMSLSGERTKKCFIEMEDWWRENAN